MSTSDPDSKAPVRVIHEEEPGPGLSTISEGDKLEFEVQPDQKGPKAVNLKFAE